MGTEVGDHEVGEVCFRCTSMYSGSTLQSAALCSQPHSAVSSTLQSRATRIVSKEGIVDRYAKSGPELSNSQGHVGHFQCRHPILGLIKSVIFLSMYVIEIELDNSKI